MTYSADLFPVLDELAFFNHAGVSPLPRPAADAVRGYVDHATRRGWTGSDWVEQIDALREDAATLLGARGGHEIGMVPNTATGLSIVAGSLPWQPGDHIVVTDAEYPSNRHTWTALGAKGVEIDIVAAQPDGRIPTEDVVAAIGERTRLLAISHVQWGSGFRSPLRPLADAVHAQGGLLVVDAIQSAGAMPIDVVGDDVDFLAAGGHKWMLGPTGSGLLYVRENLIEELIPPLLGASSMVDGLEHGGETILLKPDASRFEPGAGPTATLLGLRGAIALLLEVGLESVWAQLSDITDLLCEGLASIGCNVFSPRGAAERSGIVCFDRPPALAERETIDETWERLLEQDIATAIRFGRLRASPHFYTPPEHVERLVAALG